ncbi:MAG: S1-like domain-containing RNA-binding protein [Acetivibrio sp.]
MIRLGETQDLIVNEHSNSGVYLISSGETEKNTRPSWQPEKEEKVLLPNNQVPEGTKIGDVLTVFIYKDSEDRIIATLLHPTLKLHEVAILKVVEVGAIGAFLDWGLAKDLFLPFKEQTKKVQAGEEVLVTLYIDKSERLCATMNVYKALRCDAPYQTDDHVSGRVYEPSGNFGVFVAVDDQYSAIIPKKEVFREYFVGEIIEARVTDVREDGKLNLSVREKVHIQLNSDSEMIYEMLLDHDGFLPYNDKSSPEDIKEEFSLSKNAFKRGIGHLMKEKKITIEEDGIHQKSIG